MFFLLLLLAVYFVRNGKLLAALCATGSENATTICGLHALTETVLVVALAVVRLECSFHFYIDIILLYSAKCSRILSAFGWQS